MSIRKGKNIRLSQKAVGYRLLTNEEYQEREERVRDQYTCNGKYPFMNCAGESVIVSRNTTDKLGGCEVKVVDGRARWDLDYTAIPPKNMMRVSYEGKIYLVSRKFAITSEWKAPHSER